MPTTGVLTVSATISRFASIDTTLRNATHPLGIALIAAVALRVAAALPAAAIDEIDTTAMDAEQFAADAPPQVHPEIDDAGVVRRYLAALTVVATLLFVWAGLCAI